MNIEPKQDAAVGCLLGTAIGDALGLACEGIPRRRQGRMFPDISRYHFAFGRGMVSDDTEHACLVAQAFLESGGDAILFQKRLARHLRVWLWTLPAGIGRATLLACLRLNIGIRPERSGVFSAGNGPAMRSALLGICCGEDRMKLRELVRASTRLTHTDPKAEWGAYAVALAAALASQPGQVVPRHFLDALTTDLEADAEEFLALVRQAVTSACAGQAAEQFADGLGQSQGISGYIYHTVPVVLQTWLRHQEDFRGGMTEIIRCGGDTDTTAAILGAILGAHVGKAGIPSGWLDRLWEWPRTVAWMEEVGLRLAQGGPQAAPPAPFAAQLLRNFVFLMLVLGHIVRRTLPPY